jgi:redox-sensing transcriptional repressor
MRYHRVPDETVRRLPLYLRGIGALSEQGQSSISSRALADFLGVNPWQIRKDFSYFGEFGKPGVGYEINKLRRHIAKVLNLNSGHNVALVGVGNLGSAVLAYTGFGEYRFKIIAAFDSDPDKIGKKKNGLVIEDVSRIAALRQRNVDLGIIAVPAGAAQKVAEALVASGVRGILNFSPVRIAVPKKVKIITIDIATELARLPYYVPAG